MAKYYYNDILLPEIPADALTKYTKFVIIKRSNAQYRLFASTNEWYVNYPALFLVEASEYSTYLAVEEDNAWTVEKTSTNEGNYDVSYGLIWANHDILNGSATATNIYLYASEPVPEGGAVEDIKYSIYASSLTAIGDAIRAKTGEEGLLSLAEMVEAIDTIDGIPVALPSVEGGLF